MAGMRHPVTGKYLWKFGTRQALPNVRIALVQGKKSCPALTFHTEHHMTKFEIKQFLTRVYGFNVRKVNTLNYEQEKRASRTKRGVWVKHRAGFKRAYVYLAETPAKHSIFTNMEQHDARVKRIVAGAARTPDA